MDIFQIVRLNEKEKYHAAIGNVDINSLNEVSQNLLHEAVTYGRVDIGIDLLGRGINVNQPDNNGQTPLHYTALYNQVQLAEHIIATGGEINMLDSHGNSSLWTATFNAEVSMNW